MTKQGRAYAFIETRASLGTVTRELNDITRVMAEYSDSKDIVVSNLKNRENDKKLGEFIRNARRQGLSYMVEGIGKENTSNRQVANDLAMYLNQASQTDELSDITGSIIYQDSGRYTVR